MTDHGTVIPGEPITIDWRNRDLLAECCDCGLVHRHHFVVVDDKIILQSWRDDKKTEQARKKKTKK
jgi:hypothetical protein